METTTLTKINLTSSEFEPGEEMPRRFTCDGDNINPPLKLENLPLNTASVALLLEDPDAPGGTWTHWLAWDLPPEPDIEEGLTAGIMGNNDFGTTLYKGPCPAIGTHRYFFRVYALDVKLDLPTGSTREALMKAMEYHVSGSGELLILYGQSEL
ncbi:YbhB/YbcL family Raf kinase inhibitor-like protein [Pontibacter burrus]|uniref:YbhB/YbcL family Raf kinase inhibitor-like protein n=1 Tax=Pontibacter burrus TaxID=2704466 RepID=A0A6B3LP47_9BACT|nr:YbhB/YbcL family Raf kinase inhibitor-like protein [Pontibacter burrus]NEM97653.1 YbhB/YbcL family Raf kinase inhibitor-like protein [Pontibacter burrus]